MRRAAALVLLLSTALVWPATAAEPGLLITVGEVTDTGAVLWVRGVAWGPVAVRYGPVRPATDSPTPDPQVPEAQAEIRVSPNRNLTGKLSLQPLEPATRYRYTVSQNHEQVSGEFVTAPPPATSGPVRFAWSGDLGSRGYCRPGADGYPIFRAMARRPVDFFVFVGDTIYAESEVISKRESASRPTQGIVTVRTVGKKSDGVRFMSFERTILVPKRGHDIDY